MDQPNSSDWQDEADWKDETASAPPAEPSILQRYVQKFANPPGHARLGGTVGGIVGSVVGGLPGTVAGAGVGNLVGQRLLIGDEAVAPGQKKNSSGFWPTDYTPAHPPTPEPDYEAAAIDAGTQGTFSGMMRLAGAGAARFGFPRLAGVLGARPPVEAVEAATPSAVKGVSTSALQGIDAASLAGNPAAKEIAAISAEQARRDAVLALERQTSERTMAPIQQRMAGRVPGLAAKTQGFVDELKNAVPADKLDKAFQDAPSIHEAASNPAVMGARQGMIQEAVPQTVDNQALKLARRPLAAAEARGVSGPPTQAAADAAGLRELGGNLPADNSYLTRVVNRVPGVGTAMQILPKGGMSPDRVAQSTAAILASRGSQTINPVLAKMLEGGATYRASPVAQAETELLRKYLSQNR